jgi:hypothetical protein
MYLGAGAKQRQGCGDERLLDDEDQDSDEQCGEQRAAEVVHDLVLISGPMRLRDQAGGRHAQEAEGPVDGIEKDAAHGNAAQCCRAGQMAGEDRVHHGEQWLGQVRKNELDGEQEDSPVPVGHSHDVVELGFHIGCCFAIRERWDETALVAAKCLHRLNAGSSASGNPSSEKGYDQQQEHRPGIGKWIRGAHTQQLCGRIHGGSKDGHGRNAS